MKTGFEEELEELKVRHLYREIRPMDSTEGLRARWNGKEVLLFCGNDYLGLSRHPDVIQAATETTQRYGVGSGAARLVSGNSDLHTRLEKEIARFKKKDRALLYTTGYLANLGVLTALAHPGDLIVLDKLSHASLIDGARLSGATVRVFPHKNYRRLEEILASSRETKKMIVSDTLFSMDGDIADIAELIRIKEKSGALLILDDAHGLGVLGATGKGACEDLGLEEKVDFLVGTLSKAAGCLGGFVAARGSLIEYLINFSRPFIFATSLPPLVCAAALAALRVIEEDGGRRQKLWQNARLLHEGLPHCGFESGPLVSPILPVVVGEEKKAIEISEYLLKEGFFVPAIRTPTVAKGKARLRFTVSADHDPADIRRLVHTLELIKKDFISDNLGHNNRKVGIR